MTYNGWTNYETWVVALWMDNEPETYSACRSLSAYGDEYDVSRALETYVRDLLPDLGASLAADLLGAALSEVDWREIVRHYREDGESESRPCDDCQSSDFEPQPALPGSFYCADHTHARELLAEMDE